MALGWCAMIHDFDTLGSESNYHLWSGSLPHNCIPVHCRPQTRGDERCLGRGAIEWCQHRHAWGNELQVHYSDVIMSAMTSQITGVSMVCSTVCSGADWGKHQSSALLAFVTGFHRWPMNSPHKGPVRRKCFHLMTSSCGGKSRSLITWLSTFHQQILKSVGLCLNANKHF